MTENTTSTANRSIFILIFFLVCSIATQAQTTAWDGTIADKIANAGNGTGTEDNPIEIASPAELAYLAQQTNTGGKELTLENGGTINGKTNFQDVYFKLTEDIDLGEHAWIPIGKDNSNPFQGVLDGNEKTIRNISSISTTDNYYAGLFGRVENGSILNLQIEIASTGLHVQEVENVGTLAGYTANSIITNCHIKGGNITGDSPIYIQLIVGGLIGQIEKSEVTNCSNTVDVKATLLNAAALASGGIIGISLKSSITNCRFSGSVMAVDERTNGTPNSYTGGITGASDLVAVGGTYGTSTISECTADVKISAGAYAGGIVGYFTEGDVEKSTVKGLISIRDTGGQAGGIIGRNRWGGTVTDCYNSASVTSLNTAGGIVGYEYTPSLFTISKCWSSGDITAPIAGGIAGMVGFGTIEECYASGNITGNDPTGSYAGGIAAYASSETIINCTSTANVTAEREGDKQAFAGGIVGVGLKYSSSPNGTSIQNCYATGKINSNFAAGGIAGLNQDGSIIHCIALNKEGIGEIAEIQSLLKATTGIYGRITAEKQGTLTSNFASPLIPGNWSNDAAGKDGDDLTSDNFTKDTGKAFDQWDDTNVWSFDPSGINLPILKAFGENTGGGQPEKQVQPNIPKSDYLAFTLTFDTPQNGIITVSSPTNNSIQTGSSITGGTVLTITATPNSGYDLTSLKVNDTDFTSGTTYTVSSDVKVEASFNKKEPEPKPEPEPEPGPGPDYPITYRSVILPQVEGITTDPQAGEYEIESWSSFRFYLTLDPEYDQSKPIVTTDRGETITPRTSDGAYIIKYVRSNVEIFIDGVVKNTGSVANGTVEADDINIRTLKDALYIHVPQPETVSVYSFSGILLHRQELATGDTRIPMPSGIYIVKVGGKVVKVIV